MCISTVEPLFGVLVFHQLLFTVARARLSSSLQNTEYDSRRQLKKVTRKVNLALGIPIVAASLALAVLWVINNNQQGCQADSQDDNTLKLKARWGLLANVTAGGMIVFAIVVT